MRGDSLRHSRKRSTVLGAASAEQPTRAVSAGWGIVQLGRIAGSGVGGGTQRVGAGGIPLRVRLLSGQCVPI